MNIIMFHFSTVWNGEHVFDLPREEKKSSLRTILGIWVSQRSRVSLSSHPVYWPLQCGNRGFSVALLEPLPPLNMLILSAQRRPCELNPLLSFQITSNGWCVTKGTQSLVWSAGLTEGKRANCRGRCSEVLKGVFKEARPVSPREAFASFTRHIEEAGQSIN